MSYLRSDLWCGAFVRRHNDLGHFCVVSRRGDPIAGQVFVEVDHLNGTVSLFTPASFAAREEPTADRLFQLRFDKEEPAKVRERIEREIEFDPDLWVLSLELRQGDIGLLVV
ncbi:hypothetical protein VE25_11595 [Devosia geojensis]|uniref:DUF1491 domain-containing protein n=1 Tax=Devosia geojensis TaxID=443610 RepID=A0A0F5FRZ7_9HYPH|nr:DUF1491 family protein [Devosia geojensis]KKB11626.1 hypothetical protein VE25_11595 [Devosia geojensis]